MMTDMPHKVAEKFGTYCPKCGYPQHCGCRACRPRLPAGIIPYKWVMRHGIEGRACGNCGFVASEDYWFDVEVAQSRIWQIIDGKVPVL